MEVLLKYNARPYQWRNIVILLNFVIVNIMITVILWEHYNRHISSSFSLEHILKLQKDIKNVYSQYPHKALRLFERIIRIKNRSKQDSGAAGTWKRAFIYGNMAEITIKVKRNEDAINYVNQCIKLDSSYAKVGNWH